TRHGRDSACQPRLAGPESRRRRHRSRRVLHQIMIWTCQMSNKRRFDLDSTWIIEARRTKGNGTFALELRNGPTGQPFGVPHARMSLEQVRLFLNERGDTYE